MFRSVLPSNLEKVPFPELSASLCIFSFSHTRNVGRIAIKESTEEAEVAVSLSLLSQPSSFFIGFPLSCDDLFLFVCFGWTVFP